MCEHTVGYIFESNVCHNDGAIKVLPCAVEMKRNYCIVIVSY